MTKAASETPRRRRLTALTPLKNQQRRFWRTKASICQDTLNSPKQERRRTDRSSHTLTKRKMKMGVTMRIKGIGNLKRILLIVIFGALSRHLSVSAIDQSELVRLMTRTQKPGDGQIKPSPKPTPTPVASQQPKK